MSSEMEKYKQYTDQFGLTEQEAGELIGALQCIAESLLNKKYILNPHERNTETK